MAADTKILTSIHGYKLGLNRANSLLMAGREVLGGKLSTGAMLRAYDHFDGAVLSTKWAGLKGSDGSAVTPVINVQAGGKVRLTTASAGTASMAVGGAELVAARNWQVNKTAFLLGAGLQASALTNLSLFCGMTDKVTLEAPFSLAAGTLTSNATDGFGFLLDAGATVPGTWKCVGVANNVDAAVIDSGVTAVAATDNELAIEVDASGNATFYIDGVAVGNLAGVCTPTVALTPAVSAWIRTTAAALTVDVDYFNLEQSR